MVEVIRKEDSIIITGPINSGKSTFLFKYISENTDKKFMGFITLPVFIYGKKGYYLRGINIPFNNFLASTDPIMLHPPILKWRKWFFSLWLFEKITHFIIENFSTEYTYIIDEIGPLEKEGKGWNKLFDFLVKSKCKKVVVSGMRSGEKKT